MAKPFTVNGFSVFETPGGPTPIEYFPRLKPWDPKWGQDQNWGQAPKLIVGDRPDSDVIWGTDPKIRDRPQRQRGPKGNVGDRPQRQRRPQRQHREKAGRKATPASKATPKNWRRKIRDRSEIKRGRNWGWVEWRVESRGSVPVCGMFARIPDCPGQAQTWRSNRAKRLLSWLTVFGRANFSAAIL